MFETNLAAKLATLDPTVTTFVEAESSKVGDRSIPPSVWALMANAARIQINAPIEARSHFLCRAYEDITHDKEELKKLIDKLRPYHSAERIDQWHAQAKINDWQTLATSLILYHYDPRYTKSSNTKDDAVYYIELSNLKDSTLANTAEALHAKFS